MYAIIWRCEKFNQYLKGYKATVYTDHQNLEWLQTAVQPKLKRWALRLSEYNIDTKHIAGKRNCIADWISRSRNAEDDELPSYAYVPIVTHILHDDLSHLSIPTTEEMAIETRKELLRS